MTARTEYDEQGYLVVEKLFSDINILDISQHVNHIF